MNQIFLDKGDFDRTGEPNELYIRGRLNDEVFDICNFGCNDTGFALDYATALVDRFNKALTPIGGENLPKATIEDNEGDFCVYDESGHLIYDGFDSYEKARSYASEDGYEVVELIHTAPIGEGVEGDARFNYMDLSEEPNIIDLQQWVDDRQLEGLVDESRGGIVGYFHREHVDEYCSMLNENARLTEQVKEYAGEIDRLQPENEQLKEMVSLLMSELGEHLDTSDDQFGRESNNTYQSASELLNRINK